MMSNRSRESARKFRLPAEMLAGAGSLAVAAALIGGLSGRVEAASASKASHGIPATASMPENLGCFVDVQSLPSGGTEATLGNCTSYTGDTSQPQWTWREDCVNSFGFNHQEVNGTGDTVSAWPNPYLPFGGLCRMTHTAEVVVDGKDYSISATFGPDLKLAFEQ